MLPCIPDHPGPEVNATKDRGGERSAWVICSDVGGPSFLHEVKRAEGIDVPVFCLCLDKARRFNSLGDLMEVLAIIPAKLEAYEEDPRFLQWMDAHEYPETPDNSF